MPDFEGREEPAVAEDFLRFRVEAWAENFTDALAKPGDVVVRSTPISERRIFPERAFFSARTSEVTIW